MPSRGRTEFQTSWITEFSWVEPVEDNLRQARCTFCRKAFAIDTMGRQAVVSHSKSKKHKKIFNAAVGGTVIPITSFLKNITLSSTSTVAATASVSEVTTPSPMTEMPHVGKAQNYPTLKERTMDQFLKKEATTRREIIWCLGTVVNHDSLRNSEEKVSLVKYMFSDIPEVQSLQLSKAKISYIITYGLGPYFKSELECEIKSCSRYVFGFDESLNKVSQKQQMDVTVRYWNPTKNEVSTRYLTSVFLGHSTAKDILLAFNSAISDYNKEKILQLSMDGPNVNFKFLKLLKDELKEMDDGNGPELLEIGSCGIHTLHCAFKNGINATGWDLIQFLRAIYNLFKNVPSRRCDYMKITDSTVFPLKFCAVRWLENAKVAARAEMILPNLKKYVEFVSKDTKYKPKCNSFAIVEVILKDALLPAKLCFFRSIAEDIEPFLREYQSDSPLAPFLYDSLTLLLNSFLDRLVKKEVLKSTALAKIDLSNKENLKRYQDFDLGYATREALRHCRNSKNSVKDVEILKFRQEAMNCLRILAQKILERSPLKYRLTKAISCLNPSVILSADGAHQACLRSALEILVKSKKKSGHTADNIERQFKAFCEQKTVNIEMREYERMEERLDHFWVRILGNDERWNQLREFVKTILILSHGNANLERGFSINKECLTENLQEQSLIAQRQVYDSVLAVGGITNISIKKSLVHAARNAHCKYKEALTQKRKDDENLKKQSEDRKRKAQEKKELTAKKMKILREIEDKKNELDKINAEL